jgi:hypothetical protein
MFEIFERIQFCFGIVVCGFKQQHTSRAYCCRLNKALSTIHIHHPQIGRILNWI